MQPYQSAAGAAQKPAWMAGKKDSSLATGFLRLSSIFNNLTTTLARADSRVAWRSFFGMAIWYMSPSVWWSHTADLSPIFLGQTPSPTLSFFVGGQIGRFIGENMTPNQLAFLEDAGVLERLPESVRNPAEIEIAKMKHNGTELREAVTARDMWHDRAIELTLHIGELEEANANQRARIVELEAENGRLYETINNLIGGLQPGEMLP